MNWLARQALLRPEATAIRAAGRVVSYAELAAAAARGASALAAAGVGAGDRVAVRLANRPEHAVAVHAITWLGSVLVPLHARWVPAEAAALLGDAGAALLVAAAGDPVAAAALPCPVLDAGRLGRESAEPSAPAAPAPQPAGSLHSLLFTSGTTGRPHAVPLTHGNHLASAAASAFNLGVRPGDDWLCPLPLAHVGGLAVLLRSVLYGTSVTLVDGFDPLDLAARLRSGAVTHASLVPTLLRRLLEAAPGDAPLGSARLRAVLLGGGPVDPAVVERALARGLPLLGTYGMTETASQVATVPPEAAGARPGSAGLPLPGAELVIRTEAGEPVPTGETGEIHVRGAMVSREAVRSSGGTDGWLATGDLGRLDPDGFLWVEGRREGVVVTGGENVSAREVEAVLREHPQVADCAVAGLPDPEWGQVVAAAIVPRDPQAPPAPDALAEHCRARLAPFKVPKRWRIVPELPRTPLGKVATEELRRLFNPQM